MSKVFWVERRDTGEKWTKNKWKYGNNHAFVALYDSGYAFVVDTDGCYTYTTKLDPKVWVVKYRGELNADKI